MSTSIIKLLILNMLCTTVFSFSYKHERVDCKIMCLLGRYPPGTRFFDSIDFITLMYILVLCYAVG